MKLCTVILFVLGFVSVCYGTLKFEKNNTKTEGCIDEVCGSVCSHDGMQIFPGQIYNIPGICSIYACSEDFAVTIEG